ncbi:glycoside hydrolase family 16 protein [Trametes polyzona]|nr:glycoside hydrolase family 16 protein [Trametes polyzona]
MITALTEKPLSKLGAFNLGGINASGQVPDIPGYRGLIDVDTPKEAYTKQAWHAGETFELVFSDEFNVDGRTFYPGDDPYWEAVDLHYWATNNLEWYDPEAITTKDGSLVITLERKETHNLHFQGGMMSSWNKFCFTGGYIEANVSLPGVNNVVGLWPAIWTMGNLGRAGYGASLEGMWPYTYDSCDIGTVANQTINNQPEAATVGGDTGHNGILSFLPGQKLSRCTCEGESHPGPKHSDGTFVGRAAPEIDMFEAQITGNPLVAQVSQSAQWAPFNHGYIWLNTSDNEIIVDPTISEQNTFIGSVTQQATSVVTATDPNCYEYETGCFSIYGFEYKPGFEEGYITWISNNKVSWTLMGPGLGPDPLVQISERPVPPEPMYIIMNLGMSHNFGEVDLDHLPFPVHMRVDYIRVYQPSHSINIGCDPKDYPTQEYINTYLEAYSNPNLTTWRDDYGQPWPKNSFLGQC